MHADTVRVMTHIDIESSSSRIGIHVKFGELLITWFHDKISAMCGNSHNLQMMNLILSACSKFFLDLINNSYSRT